MSTSTVKLEQTINKSGYLVKLAMESGRNWKKRYFILNGNTMTYFVDHNSINSPKGDLLLTAEASVEETSLPGKEFCVIITTPFHSLVVAAKDNVERQAWKKAIEESILQARRSVRGYITKKGGFGVVDRSRKFFILHETAITWHEDHEHTSQIQGMFTLSADTEITSDDQQNKINLVNKSTKATLGLRFDKMHDDYLMWNKGILKRLNIFVAEEKATEKRIDEAYDKAIKRGMLAMRPPKGFGNWEEKFFALTSSELLVMERDTSNKLTVIDMFELHSNCSVFDTNLKPFSFELVTPKNVLHVKSESASSTASWVATIRQVISNSITHDDPLLHAALSRVEEDVFYEVSFQENKPLGIVLERAGEWATVKLSNLKDTGVTPGSALTTINAESYVLKPYSATINRLRNWRPPLVLVFRRAPRKVGYLVKLSRQRHGNSQNWQKRYFIMAEGRLIYKENENESAPKGDIPLMGSAVSLVPSTETGKFFCFKVLSGVTSLTMQAETIDEMMDWASMLYHAIAIANGGSHILGIERKRVAEEEARLRAKEEALAAKAAAEKARAEAAAREAARLKAAEEEAIRRAVLAEAERLALEEADRRARVIEETDFALKQAVESGEIPLLEQAISAASHSEFPNDLPTLAEAQTLLLNLKEKQRLRQLAKDNATNELNSALASANLDNLETLQKAIEVAEESAVDDDAIESAKSKLFALRQEKGRRDEVRNTLAQAIALASVASLLEALELAKSTNYSGSEVETAKILLVKLEAEEKQRIEEENARLAAEAAALDAEIAAAAAAAAGQKEEEIDSKLLQRLSSFGFAEHGDAVDSEGDEDFFDDVEEDELTEAAASRYQADQPHIEEKEVVIHHEEVSPVISSSPQIDDLPKEQPKKERRPSLLAQEAANSIGSGKVEEATKSLAKQHSSDTPVSGGARSRRSGRKLLTRKERMLLERKRSFESRNTIVTDEEFEKVFDAFAVEGEVAGVKTLKPVHFSTIWRLVSNDKGNLFKEMQLFHRFDVQNNGFLVLDEFIKGWRLIAQDRGQAVIVDRLKILTSMDSLLL